ncbi:MAG: Alpha-galactosidase [candidate division BRC1 bacterium ADurb.BinA364]|nr:MAG: Alpha-galactosidase [candidate division BRC1 bacterium ADurb.BinA364]
MHRIAIIGAGSVTFAKTIVNDILFCDPFKNAEIRLMDIDSDRLDMATKTMETVAKIRGAQCRFVSTLDRVQAIDGADFVVTMIQVGGDAATNVDFDVCRKHGLKLAIGDSMGIPGVARALRNAPVMLDLCHEMERHCPKAILLNYTNPMGMNCGTLLRGSKIQTVGLCHGVFGTARKLAGFIGADFNRVRYLCAGINHMAFFLKYEVDGRDAYPDIRRAFDTTHKDEEKVRQEVFRRLGYFMTESSYHLSEYLPWFIKSDALIEEYDIAVDEYLLRSAENKEIYEKIAQAFKDGKNVYVGETEGIVFTPRSRMRRGRGEPGELTANFRVENKASSEYGSHIMNAVATGKPFVFNGNILNRGEIENLPRGACVEVPCVADKNGIQPTHIGELPPQCAALIQTNLNVQELAVRAILEQNRDYLIHAALMDPLASAVLSTKPIVALMDELLEAHRGLIPQWCQK